MDMYKPTKRIFLQVKDDFGDEAVEITWCADKQYKYDVEYIRLDLHDAEITRLQGEVNSLNRVNRVNGDLLAEIERLLAENADLVKERDALGDSYFNHDPASASRYGYVPTWMRDEQE